VDVLTLDQNSFDPTRQTLGMDLRVDQPGTVQATVWNVTGEEVAGLLDGPMGAGNYRISWDGHNKSGSVVGNGLYLIVVQSPADRTIRKVVVLR